MTFAQPEWLLGLIAVPFIALSSWLAWKKRGLRWKRLVAPRLRQRLSRSRPPWVHFTTLGLALTGWSGLVIAMAQPESGEEWIEIENEGRNILFCIDISRSMLAEDVTPSRLLASRAAALEILEKFPGDRVGVLLFSGETLVQSPLTLDHSFVEQTLAQLDPNDIPYGGSNLTTAISAGTLLLKETGQLNNIMVIFSDGEKSSDDLFAAAKEAKEAGVFIYALGMGTTDGTTIPDSRERDGRFRDRSGNVVLTRLDEQALEVLADETGGYYSRGMGGGFLGKLDTALNRMDRFQDEGRHQRVAKPAHQWFAVGGIFLLMSSLFVRSLPLQPIAALIVFAFSLPQAEAGSIDDGLAALEAGSPSEAHKYFREAARSAEGTRAAKLHLSAGSAAAQAKDWEAAIESFSDALASDDSTIQQKAHYGFGNSLFYHGAGLEKEEKIKAWKGAIEHFEGSLENLPDHQPSLDNLAAVKAFLKKLEEKPPSKQEEDPPPEKEEPKDDSEKPEDKPEPKEEPGGDPKEQEEPDDKENPGNSDQEEPKEKNPDAENKGQGNPEKDPKGNDPKKGDPKKTDTEPKGPLEPDPNAPEDETPEERARRIIGQFDDSGAKAPRRVRRPNNRSAHDW